MTASRIWVVVADAGRARAYEFAAGSGTISEVGDFARTHDLPSSGEILADRPGRTFESADSSRHAMEPTSDPHREAKRQFAHDIALDLAERLGQGAFTELMVFAPPGFLGDLRAAMPDKLRKSVRVEVDKDLTKLPVKELPARFAEAFRP